MAYSYGVTMFSAECHWEVGAVTSLMALALELVCGCVPVGESASVLFLVIGLLRT